MDVLDAMRTRYTARAYKPQPVDKETVLKILEAANRAPSWGNSQPWHIYVAAGEVTERIRQGFLERLHQGVPRQLDIPGVEKWPAAEQQRIGENGAARFKAMGIARDDKVARQGMVENNHRFFGAPCVVYICMDRTLTTWSVYDIGLLTENILLAATEYGVDSAVAVNLVNYPDIIRAEMGIPDSLAVVIGIALGYADPDDKWNIYRSTRRPIEEVVHLKGF